MRHDTRLAVRNGPTTSGVAFPFVLKRLSNTPYQYAFKSYLYAYAQQHVETWSGSGGAEWADGRPLRLEPAQHRICSRDDWSCDG